LNYESTTPVKAWVSILLTTKEEISIFDMGCKEIRVRSAGIDGPYKKFVLPAIGAWKMLLAVAE
jgi:hypothetical protein